GLSQVSQVRIVDIPGDGRCLDSNAHPIYDPYPTQGSVGFDLDGVAVIHAASPIPTHIGGTSNWTDVSNWSTGAAPNAISASAIIQASSAKTIALDSAVTLGSL